MIYGAESPVWSPDGETVAFLAQSMLKDEEAAPEKVADERIVTKIRYRFNGIGYLDRFKHLFTIPAAGGEATQLTSGDNQNSQPTWTPHGTAIVFVSNRRADRQQSSASTIFAVDRDGGEPRQLTEDDASFANPAVSPDGTRVAFTGHLDYKAGSSKTVELWTASIDGGDLISHSASYDRSMGDAGMSDVYFGADSRPVWMSNQTIRGLSASEGATSIVEVDLTTNDVKSVIGGDRRIVAFSPVSDSRIVFAAGDMSRPFELFIADADGANERQLTHHNRAWLDEVKLSEPIALDVTAEDGKQIQAWVLPPYGFHAGKNEKHPLILQIHGGPHAMYGYAMFHEMQLMAAKGYAVLFCNPRGSVGYGEEFAATTRGRWGESDMPDVMAALDQALELGWIDKDRLGVTGGSYGGYLTNWIVGHTDRFKAAVTQRCVANFHSFFGTSDIGYDFGEHEFGGVPWSDSAKLLKYSPITYVDKITTPLLIVHGEQDLRCPIEQAEQMFVALKYLGREVEFVRIPEENHELSRSGTPSRRLARLHHLIGWFERHMPACGNDDQQ
jgi:dipeptidyl aminopeptidase/acylaminoacyl peptidase